VIKPTVLHRSFQVRYTLLPRCRLDAFFGKRVPGSRHIEEHIAMLGRSCPACELSAFVGMLSVF
jgi:hypothetical protein